MNLGQALKEKKEKNAPVSGAKLKKIYKKPSCQISDRDIQCDFDNEFWEESDCNWRYNHSLVLASLGVDSYQLTREKVTTNYTNYWRANDSKTGNFVNIVLTKKCNF